MERSEYVGRFIYETFVRPARERGDKVVRVKPSDVHRALESAYSLAIIRGVLGSMKFRNTYHLPLFVVDGPIDGSVRMYTFKLDFARSKSSPT